MTRKMVSLNINVPWKADNSKSIQKLGVSYRPLGQTMNDLFEQLIESGAFKKTEKSPQIQHQKLNRELSARIAAERRGEIGPPTVMPG